MIVGTARRWALLLVASALAVGPVVVAPSASADDALTCVGDEACVHLTFPDSATQPVDVPASYLAANADLVGADYPVKYGSGQPADDSVTGESLYKLLDTIVPSGVGSVVSTIATNPNNGYESPLHQGDLSDPSQFYNQLQPAFGLYGTGSTYQIEYIRPQRTPDDVNGPDRFIAGSQTPVINLQVRTSGAVVHPTISVGKGPWGVKSRVPFSASFAANDPPHEGATFAWTFAAGDPPTPGKITTSHRYRQANTYTVTVSVTGDDPDIGEFHGRSDPVTVVVGKQKHHKVVTGPTGGTGDGKKHNPAQGPPKGNGHHEGSSPTGGNTAAPTSIPSDAPTATTAAPGTIATAASSGAPTAAASPTAHTSAPGSTGGGAFVQGVLLAGGAEPVNSAPPSAATRAAASARRPARADTSFDARWLWFLAPILLLLGGALGERRRIPHRHGSRSRT